MFAVFSNLILINGFEHFLLKLPLIILLTIEEQQFQPKNALNTMRY